MYIYFHIRSLPQGIMVKSSHCNRWHPLVRLLKKSRKDRISNDRQTIYCNPTDFFITIVIICRRKWKYFCRVHYDSCSRQMPGMCDSVMVSKLKGTGSKNRSGVFYVPSYIKDLHTEYKKEPWLAKKNWIFKSNKWKASDN